MKLATGAYLAAVAMTVAVAPSSLGQAAPASAPAEVPAKADEEVVVLSPFEVNSSSSEGYLATSSLAGSRLNTQLKDVAASISVVTPQFLADTGATDMEDLLVYTTSTEVGGLQGNFGGDPTKTRRTPDRTTRIRGLDGADVTRDFFLTDIPFDSYNISQVDINRGANSVLFGLGSPAGIINYTLKTPGMNRSKYAVEFRTGSFGTNRASFDVDQVVLPKVLGIRVTGVNNEQRFDQEHAFDHSKRLFGTIRFTPKLGTGVYTEVQGSVETGRGRANRPSTQPPYDYFTNWYTDLGKFTNPLGTWPGYSVATIPQQAPYLANYQAGPGGNWYDSMGVIYSDPNSGAVGMGAFDAFRQRGGPDGANGSWLSPANAGNPGSGHSNATHRLSQKASFKGNAKATAIIDSYEKATGKTWNGGWSWGDTQIADASIFDFFNESLAGPNNRQWNDFQAQIASLRQTFFDGRVGYEVAYDHQRFDDGEFLLVDSDRLGFDLNEKLRDNVTPNPNFGRAVVVGGNSATANEKSRENLRATLFGKLDFADLLGRDLWVSKALGHHTFTGMASRQKFEQLSYGYSMYKMNSDYTVKITNDAGLQGVHYLDSDQNLKTATTAAGAGIHGLNAIHTPPASIKALYFGDNTAGKAVATGTVGTTNYLDNLENMYGTSPTAYKDTDTAKAFIWQSWFLDDTVVGLFAVRNDNYQKTTKSSAKPEIKYGNQAVGLPFAEAWGWDGYTDAAGKFNPSTKIRAAQTKQSYGVMVHTPKFIRKHLPWGTDISLGYNESSNFQPGQLGTDVYGNQYPSPAGSTKDYSVLINTLNDKVSLRMTWYKSVQANSEIGGLSVWSVKNRLSRAMNGLMVESWGATGSGFSGRAQTTPEAVVNKWFFGSTYDNALAKTPLPEGWTVANHPELLKQPLRLRAAADPSSPTYIAQGTLQPDGTPYTQPPITGAEAEYRRAWFAARSDEEWARPFGMELFNSLAFIRDYSYWGGIWRDNTPSNMKGIGDNIAKGVEVEVTVNPLENWRIIANVTKREATTGNVWAAIGDYITAFGPVAKDGWNPELIKGTGIDYWHRDGFADVDAWGNNGGQMLGWDWFDDVEKAYLTKKAGEGKDVSELRKWNVNLVSTYDFSTGFLKGVGVGGALRWQDKGIIGFYPKYMTDLGVWVDDLDDPILAPAETTFDLWLSYKRKLTAKIDWRIQLNIRNLLEGNELVPIRANPDGSFSQYRISTGRTWELTTSFEF